MCLGNRAKRLNLGEFLEEIVDSGSESESDMGRSKPAAVSAIHSESESDQDGVESERQSLSLSKEPSFPLLLHYNAQNASRTPKRKAALPRKVARTEKENERPTDSICDQLTTTNSLLKSLVKRLDKHEKRLSEVEQNLCRSSDISSSSATTPVHQHKVVPPEVRVSIFYVFQLHIFILFVERN